MSNKEEHYYFVDPGIGQKRLGCPYTFFKDGHDVRTYIEPPRGYELTDFKYEPYESDNFYDGRIIAQYRKLPFFVRIIKSPLLLLFIVIGIIGIWAGLSHFFDTQSESSTVILPSIQNAKTAIDVPHVDKTTQTQIDTSMIFTEDILDAEPEKEEITSEKVTKEEVTEPVKEESVREEVTAIEEAAVPKEKEIVSKSNTEPVPTQEAQPTEALTKEQFKQEFWDLIHHKESHMSTYSSLYGKYKDLNLRNKEFFYLYLTILENANAFETWKNKLMSIPEDEIKSIYSVSELTEKLEQYE